LELNVKETYACKRCRIITVYSKVNTGITLNLWNWFMPGVIFSGMTINKLMTSYNLIIISQRKYTSAAESEEHRRS